MSSVITTAGRKLYVEKLVSQNRNAIIAISSPSCTGTACQVYIGQPTTFTLYSKSAPGGYDQEEPYLTFPSFVRVDSVKTYWAAPTGATSVRATRSQVTKPQMTKTP